MKRLVLPLKRQWFDDIKAGAKTEEFREDTPYWRKRLVDRQYDEIELTLGYPSKDDYSRRIVLPYRGYTMKTMTHPHFGDRTVTVFVIRLTEQP